MRRHLNHVKLIAALSTALLVCACSYAPQQSPAASSPNVPKSPAVETAPPTSITITPASTPENGPLPPSDCIVLADTIDKSLHAWFGGSTWSQKNAYFLTYYSQYIYYFQDSRLLRCSTDAPDKPEALCEGFELNDQYYTGNDPYEWAIKNAPELQVIQEADGAKRLYRLGNETHWYAFGESTAIYRDGKLYTHDFNHHPLPLLQCYSLDSFKAGKKPTPSWSEEVPFDLRFLWRDLYVGTGYGQGRYDPDTVSYYNVATREEGVLFDFPPTASGCSFDRIEAIDEFDGKLLAYASYRGQAHDVTYVCVYDGASGEYAVCPAGPNFGWINASYYRSRRSGNVRIGNYLYCYVDPYRYLDPMDGSHPTAPPAPFVRCVRINLRSFTDDALKGSATAMSVYSEDLANAPGWLLTDGETLYSVDGNTIYWYDSGARMFKPYWEAPDRIINTFVAKMK